MGGEVFMEIDENTLAKLNEWAERSPKSLEDLQKQLEIHYNNILDVSPQMEPSKIMQRARFMVYREVKSSRYSRAKPIDAIFFGFNQEFDLTRNDRLYALEVYEKDPARAIDQELTDEDGTPLDTNPKMPWGAPNPNYQKELKPRYIRQSVAIGRPADGDEPMKLLILTHSDAGNQALKKPPLGTPVRFAANLRTDEDARRLYNTSVNTSYEPIEMEEFGEVSESTVCDILADAPEEFKTDLAGLEDWHIDHQEDMRRVVIIEADVMYVSPGPLSSGNYLMIIEDESTMDVEGEGVTVFIHDQIAHQLDFGSGSKVFVVGRSGMGNFYDRETRTTNPDIQVPNINALGVWAIPEYKMPAEEAITIEASENVEE